MPSRWNVPTSFQHLGTESDGVTTDLPARLDALAARLAATEPRALVDRLRLAADTLRLLDAAGRLPTDPHPTEDTQ